MAVALGGCSILFDSDDLLGAPPSVDASGVDAPRVDVDAGDAGDDVDSGPVGVDAGPPPPPSTVGECAEDRTPVGPGPCLAFYDMLVSTAPSTIATAAMGSLRHEITITTDADGFYVGYVEDRGGVGHQAFVQGARVRDDGTLDINSPMPVPTGADRVSSFALGTRASGPPAMHAIGTTASMPDLSGVWVGILDDPLAIVPLTGTQPNYGRAVVVGDRHVWREPAGAPLPVGSRAFAALASVETGVPSALAPIASYRAYESPEVDALDDASGADGSAGEIGAFRSSDDGALLLWDGAALPAKLSVADRIFGRPSIAWVGADGDAAYGHHYAVAYRVAGDIVVDRLRCRTDRGVECCRGPGPAVRVPSATDSFDLVAFPSGGFALLIGEMSTRARVFERSFAARPELNGAVFPSGSMVRALDAAAFRRTRRDGSAVTVVVGAMIVTRPMDDQVVLWRMTSC
jgi:hypothetical protein